MHIRKTFGSLLALFLMLGLLMPAAISNAEETELEKIQRELDAQQNIAAEARKKVISISGQLNEIQIDLETVTKEYQDAVVKLDFVEQQIEANEKVLANIEKSLSSKMIVLNKRMRDIYENGHINYLDVLFGATDFTDFANRVNLLKRVLDQDLNLVNQIRAEQNIVIQKKAELEQNLALQERLRQEAEAKKILIEARKKDHEKLLTAAVEERDTAEKSYEELLATSRQIEEMIRRSTENGGDGGGYSTGYGNPSGSGALIWPVSGSITSPFGWRTHPIFGSSRYHTGIDIAASYGEPVAAADGGTVIFSGWMGGYGKAVILDHGSGISTLYAHNSELLVSEGQNVRKGQTISEIGSTGYSTGPHLHFEVRENGSPVNPLSYL